MKKIVGVIFLFLVTGIFFLPFAAAGSSSYDQTAEKVLEFAGSKKTLDQTAKTFVNNQLRRNSNLSPYKEMMLQFFEKYVGFEALKKNLVVSMKKEFTEKELNEIVAFYETTSGRKMIEKLPSLIRKELSFGVSEIQKNKKTLEKKITAEVEKAKKAAE